MFLLIAVVLGLNGGCKKPRSAADSQASSGPDPFREAISELENKNDAKFIEASRPILEAIANRDYERLYQLTSKHALKNVSSNQFGPDLNEAGDQIEGSIIKDMTKQQFLEGMKEVERKLGLPQKVIYVYVQTSNPEALAGKADQVDNMFNLGGMPKEIPSDIRRASIRSQFQIGIPEHQVKIVAEQMGVSEDDVRSGKAFEETEPPFMTLKMVLVEDDGLKIGYFEFMPPSILD